MKSKEALHYIKAGAWYVGKENNELKQLPLWEYEIEIIEKDLEVLEILKPMLEVKKGSTWFYLDTKRCFFDTQEQLDLVKEWLNSGSVN